MCCLSAGKREQSITPQRGGVIRRPTRATIDRGRRAAGARDEAAPEYSRTQSRRRGSGALQRVTGCWILPGCVIAPSLALETSAAYFASTPRVTLGAGGS